MTKNVVKSIIATQFYSFKISCEVTEKKNMNLSSFYRQVWQSSHYVNTKSTVVDFISCR